jgi:hypothetical protein
VSLFCPALVGYLTKIHSDLIGRDWWPVDRIAEMCKSERFFFRGSATVLSREGDEVVSIGCNDPLDVTTQLKQRTEKVLLHE